MKLDILRRLKRLENLVQGSGGASSAALREPHWYIDGLRGKDTNSGTTEDAPVATIMGGIVPKWGTVEPLLPQQTAFNVIGTQTVGQEAAFIRPQMQGVGSNFLVIGTLEAVGAPFTLGTVTPKTVGNPGNRLTIANLPGAAVAKMVVFNIDRQSYSVIDTLSGSTGTMDQPTTAEAVTTVRATGLVGSATNFNGLVDNDWTTGDRAQLYAAPYLNLNILETRGFAAAGSPETSQVQWMQMVRLPDPSPTVQGDSTFTSAPRGMVSAIYSLCIFDCNVILSGEFTQENAFLLACNINTGGTGPGASWLNWADVCAGTSRFLQCGYNAGQSALGGCHALLSGGIIGQTLAGEVYLGNVGASTHTEIGELGRFDLAPAANSETGEAKVWGPSILDVASFATCINNLSDDTFANTLKVGFTMNQQGAATAPSVSGTFTLNGTAQVEVDGNFPAGAAIAWSLKTAGSTPGTASPYFSAATVAGKFFVKSPTAGCNDVYEWTSLPTGGVALNAANADLYGTLYNPLTGCFVGSMS